MEGDTARSIRLFEKVLAIDSTHAPSLYELAILYAGAGAPEKALQYCLRANRLDTGNLWYRGQLGRLLIATQRYDSAVRCSEPIRITPTTTASRPPCTIRRENTSKRWRYSTRLKAG